MNCVNPRPIEKSFREREKKGKIKKRKQGTKQVKHTTYSKFRLNMGLQSNKEQGVEHVRKVTPNKPRVRKKIP